MNSLEDFEDINTEIVKPGLMSAPWARPLAYALFTLLCFIVFVYLGFPYKILKQRLLEQANAQLNPQYELSIRSLGPSLPLGLAASGVKIQDPKSKRIIMSAKKIKIHLPLWGLPFLITGKAKLKYWAGVYDGKVSGYLTLAKNNTSVSAALKSISVEQLLPPKVRETYKVKANGALNGKLFVDLPANNLARSNGSIDLRIKEAGIGATQLLGFLDVPDIPFESAYAKLKLEKGQIKINEGDVSFAGKDLSLNMTGNITLNRNPAYSQVRAQAKLTPSQALDNQIMSSLKKDFSFVMPTIRRAKDAKGSYGLQIRGSFSRLRVSPAR